MEQITADDGRFLTPPKEMEPILKGAYPVFYELLGHMRWFYLADEIWDGKSSIIFNANGEHLAVLTLGDGYFTFQVADICFHVADTGFRVADISSRVADNSFRVTDICFRAVNKSVLNDIFVAINKHATDNQRRPDGQLTIDPDGCPCGRQCNLCLGSMNYDEKNFSASVNFGYMNWVCYHGCIPEKVERFDGVFNCPGCHAIRTTNDVWKDWKGCKAFICLSAKGHTNCAECGEYHTCDAHYNCHHPSQCNIGITADEVTKLVIPYATKERLDFYLLRLSENNNV